METLKKHLTYCTNIHQGVDWASHLEALKQNFPSIKIAVSPASPMGIGLRLSNAASLELKKEEKLAEFKDWLKEEQAYVFTMNGFPYGEFHHGPVKEHVHTPDWTTPERLSYTQRLFTILAELLPEGMHGGVSTAPLSYRHWFKGANAIRDAKIQSTENILKVVEQLILINKNTSKVLHLDIEPEPDGLLETGQEFIDWFENFLLPMGKEYLTNKFGISSLQAEALLKEHIQLCYDVCHFALGYENHAEIISTLKEKGIKTGKIQISAALKAKIPAEADKRKEITNAFACYNEPTYLHQVIAKNKDGSILRYRDLPDALQDADNPDVEEWRSHFHVPIFLEDFGQLESTQSDILEVLQINQREQLTQYLEVETYTWEVLPTNLKLPIQESIGRELLWVKDQLP
jgi:hypothetical protein